MINDAVTQQSETRSFSSNIDVTMQGDAGCNTASTGDTKPTAVSKKVADEFNIDEISHSVEAASGKEFENLLCIEIFSGSGRLTAAIRKQGMRAVAFDRSSSRTSGPVTVLDLTKDEDFLFLMNFIKSEKDNILLVHLAPPCGTCSAARNKRHRKLEEAGYDLPVPLRSKDWPMGLPSLKGLDAAKVAAANVLYERTFQIASLCIDLQLTVSLENPENSLFWDTTPIQRLMAKCFGHHNVFQSCMMGGDRDKRTKWWCSDDTFSSFNIMCNGLHQHKEWTPVATSGGLRFPTAEEASYPFLLCERVAHLMKEKASSMGYLQAPSLIQQAKQQTSSTLQHVNMGFLARGNKLKPLVSEFASYNTWIFRVDRNEGDIDKTLFSMPKGSRIAHRKLLKWGEVRVCDIAGKVLESNIEENDMVEQISFGVPREPDDFVKEAARAGHPRFLDFRSIDEVDQLISKNLLRGAREILEERNAWLKKWLARAKELQEEENKLHSTLAPHCSTVLKGKRLLVLGEMLTEIGYPDKHLIEDICRGFKVMGWMRDSGCFSKLPKQPSLSISAMLGMARGLNEAVLAKASATDGDELVKAAWDETQLELERGWIWEDNTGDFNGLSLTHRFGLQQKKKVRVIDNFKTSGVNATCGMTEKQKLFGLDFIATTLVRAFTMGANKQVSLEGKTFDLASAYKQFPLDLEDRAVLRIAVPVPGERLCRVYGLNSLPFGATGSVAGFLRVSTALFHILTLGLGIWTGTFFDDFPVISRGDIATSTEQHVALLLDLLGMRFSKEGKKWVPFSNQMSVLGVVLDTTNFANGSVFFRHTDSRKAELNETLDRHLNEGAMTHKEAESLRGRLIWFESFLFGRVANLSLHVIGKRAIGSDNNTSLTGELRRALEFFRDRVVNGPPIEISAATGEVLLVFTDGAFEETAEHPATVGGVLYSETGIPLAFFSEVVPQKLLNKYLESSRNPIYLVELLGALVSILLWAKLFPHRYVVSYIDNEASRAALIKVWSQVDDANRIIKLYVDEEVTCFWKPWFGRVPTHSNPADAPSRLHISELISRGVEHHEFQWDDWLNALMDDAH